MSREGEQPNRQLNMTGNTKKGLWKIEFYDVDDDDDDDDDDDAVVFWGRGRGCRAEWEYN